MKTIDLTYCIDAKNEHEQLDQPCDCYRNYLYVAHNFELTRVTFCKHWKDYIVSNLVMDQKRYDYNFNRITPKFAYHLLKILNIDARTTNDMYPHCSSYNTNTNFKDIPTGAFYFYEPSILLSGTYFYNKMGFSDFFRALSERVEIKATGDTSETEYFIRKMNPFYTMSDEEKRNKSYDNLREAYTRQLDIFLELLYKINKKMAGRKNLPIMEAVNAVLKYKTKNQSNDSN